ncbi:MAG TPA: phage protein Gp27 family protein [Candidatus Binataceae bacterium]|nr:phage protein Gp27 family protein [Candidatus Binataceae bacterium]
MGVRSTVITQLPRATRLELEQRLVDNGFTDYDGLTRWLNELGFRLSRGAVNRYGRKFARQMELRAAATDHADTLAAAAAGDDGAVTEALVSLVQRRLLTMLIDTDEPIKHSDLARLARTIGDLSRTTIAHQRWLAEAQDRLELQRRAAAGEVAALERSGGLTPETAERMRAALLGIDPFDTTPAAES